MTGVGDDSRGRRMGRPWLVVGLILAVAATLVLVLSDDARLLRLGIVAALWAALVGAWLATRYRKHATATKESVTQAQTMYELELEREIAARREFELEMEAEARNRVEADSREELDALRVELTALRESLQSLLGGEVLYERVALTAQATRMRALQEQRVVQAAGGARSSAPAQLAAGPAAKTDRPPVPSQKPVSAQKTAKVKRSAATPKASPALPIPVNAHARLNESTEFIDKIDAQGMPTEGRRKPGRGPEPHRPARSHVSKPTEKIMESDHVTRQGHNGHSGPGDRTAPAMVASAAQPPSAPTNLMHHNAKTVDLRKRVQATQFSESAEEATGEWKPQWNDSADETPSPASPPNNINPTLPAAVHQIQQQSRPSGRRRRPDDEAPSRFTAAESDTHSRHSSAGGTNNGSFVNGSPAANDMSERHGSHTAGRSVSELLAAHQVSVEKPRRRRRAED